MKKLLITLALILSFVPALYVNYRIWDAIEPFAIVPSAFAVIFCYIVVLVYLMD